MNLNQIGDSPCVASTNVLPVGSVVRRVGGTNYNPIVDLADPNDNPIGIILQDAAPNSPSRLRSLSSPAPCFLRVNDVVGFGDPLFLAFPAGTTSNQSTAAGVRPAKIVGYSISAGVPGGVVLSRPAMGLYPLADQSVFTFVNGEVDSILPGSVLASTDGFSVPSPLCVRAELFGGTRERVIGVAVDTVPPGDSGLAFSFAAGTSTLVRLGSATSVTPGSPLFLGPVAGGSGTVIANPGVGAAGLGFGIGYAEVVGGPGGSVRARLSYYRTRGV